MPQTSDADRPGDPNPCLLQNSSNMTLARHETEVLVVDTYTKDRLLVPWPEYIYEHSLCAATNATQSMELQRAPSSYKLSQSNRAVVRTCVNMRLRVDGLCR